MQSRAAAGVQVQGVFEKSQAASSYSAYTPFLQLRPQIEAYLDANPRNMHHKVFILDGEITEGRGLNIGYFAQQELDVLRPADNPLEHMIRLVKEHGWQAHIASMTPGDCGSAELPAEEISRMRRAEGPS